MRIRELQRAWEFRLHDAEQTALREPALIGVGPVKFLAHFLVRPAASDEESDMAAIRIPIPKDVMRLTFTQYPHMLLQLCA